MKSNFNFDDKAPSLRLSQLRPGERAVVLAVEKPGAIGDRLLDLGFLPDTRVSLVRRAPLGDPGVYELRGYQLCLRETEASSIRVRRLTDIPVANRGDENPR